MLSSQAFYYQIMRRNVISFGTIFKDIMLVKYNADNRTEIDRRIVPLIYMPKENYITRLNSNYTNDLPAKVEITLPSMSFEITNLVYDSTRKQQSGLQQFSRVSGTNSRVQTQYMGVPYNLGFELNIYIRNIDDGLQIIEQILPFFNPEYTLTMDFVDIMGITKNVPLIIDNVNMNDTWEGDGTAEERRLVWTLNFTMQTYFFGPVSNGGGLIKTATVNLHSFGATTGGVQADLSVLQLTTANTPRGNFAVGETVYQGPDLPDANAIGSVVSWNYKSGQLSLSLIQGTFTVNSNVHGAWSGGSVLVTTVPTTSILADIVVTPNPPSANIGDDFGYVTSITESPNTL